MRNKSPADPSAVGNKSMGNEDLLKLENQLCFVVYACSRGLTRSYRPFLNQLSITYPQYLVFLVLWETDGLTVKDLGRKLYLDSGTLTPLLKRMEKAEFIRRERSSADERKVSIHLTEKGRKLKADALKVPQALVNMLCQDEKVLSHLGGIKAGLEILLDHLQKVNEGKTVK